MVIAEIPGVQQTGCFKTSLDHVLAELNLVALKLHSGVETLRRGDSLNETDQFKGLYISDKEIDAILQEPGGLQLRYSPQYKDHNSKPAEALFRRLGDDIAARKKAAVASGLLLRLDTLQRLFALSKFEIDTILICLLPEIDSRYQKLLAYLQDDITKKSPTVELVIHLLCDTFESSLKARDNFSPAAHLIKHHLVQLHDGHISKPTTLLTKFIQLDERVASFLLDSDQVDPRLIKTVELAYPRTSLEEATLPADIKKRLQELIPQLKDRGLICYLYGAYGVGKRTTAEAICTELSIPLLKVEARTFLSAETPPDPLVPLVFREGCLQNAAIFISDFDLLFGDDNERKIIYENILNELKDYPHWVFLAGARDWQPKEIPEGKPCINIELTPGSYTVRRQLWQKYLDCDLLPAHHIDLNDLADKFRLTSGQIRSVIAAARNLARWRDPENGQITNEDLYAACRQQSRQTLSVLARKIQSAYHWDDIILPRDQLDQLREIYSYVKNYQTVYGAWGFGKKVSTGKGLNVLFSGPSGTGKTMAAEIMASELKLDLFKVDLSTIVSKYIGETEKNLERIFAEGQISNAILFFDEADALFGKRSEVRDSHDRYANIEIAYLLQKMDEYEGIVILATNLRKNMDEAFARRMHYTLEFPVPEEADRYRIWTSIFPKETPLSKEADLKFMAQQFKITGGNIKNIALNAAFLAATDGGLVKMEHFIRATKREYQKTGKLCTEGDFGRYFELIKS